jgi:hypothetical protein
MLVTFRFGTLLKILTVVAVVGALWALYYTAKPATGQPAEPAKPPTAERTERAPVVVRHRVHGTDGHGLNLRACASVRCARLGAVPEGATLRISCRASGRSGDPERRWLRATFDGKTAYAAARYLKPTTSTSIPRCGARPKLTHLTARG